MKDELSQVRSQIMLMEPMSTLVKTFSLILQQKREFKATFHSNSQDSTTNLAFHEGHGKKFHCGFSSNRGRGCFPRSGGCNPRYYDHCHRTNHTFDFCWIKHDMPQGSNLHTKVVDTISSTTNLRGEKDDKAEV